MAKNFLYILVASLVGWFIVSPATISGLMEAIESFFSYAGPLLVIFLPIILVHELGHLLAGIFLGVKPEAFAVFFGPTLYQFEYKNISWKINSIPLGGYVKFAEEGEDQLENQSYFKKLVIYLAGPVANFLFALVIFCFAFSFFFQIHTYTVLPQDSYALSAGLQVDDEIIAIDDQPFGTGCQRYWYSDDLNNWTDGTSNSATKLNFKVLRADQPLNLMLDREENQRLLLALSRETCFTIQDPLNGIVQGTKVWLTTFAATLGVYGELITGLFTEEESENRLVGIVGISEMSKDVVSNRTLFYNLFFIAFLNLAIGCLNLMPIPILDGGQICYMTLEQFSQFFRNKKVKQTIFSLATIFIILLTFFLVYRDLQTPVIEQTLNPSEEPVIAVCDPQEKTDPVCFVNLSTTQTS